MQIGPLKTATDAAPGKVSGSDAIGRPAQVSAADKGKAAAQPTSPSSSSPLRRGLNAWDQELNRELADAQQAMQFLDQSVSQLESLKSDISAKIAGRQMSDAQLADKLSRFADIWRRRQAVSGGSLDPQLGFSSSAPATQSFTIRGLNIQTLKSGGKETLTFAVGGPGQSLQSVSIDPSLSDNELIRRFDQSLATVNIRVRKGDDGELIFTVPESSWPVTRDTIAVRGDGIRFPTGEFNRVKANAVAPALDPQTWQAQDIQSLRQTLQRVIQALDRIKQSREFVSRALTNAARRVEQMQSGDDAATVAALAQEFATTAAQPAYQTFSSTVAALLGISRDRVLALLGLG